MKPTKHILLMAAMLLSCVTRISAEIILTEEDGLLATTSTNSAGTLQYEFTSDLFTLDEATNTLYFTFLRGNSTNGALCDASHYPYVALSEFYLYDGEGNEIALNASNFSTNAQEPSEGPIANICDGDRSSFWHSTWSSGVGDYHYLKITLPAGQELTEFKFGYITRNTRQCLPGAIHIGTTNDNISFSLSGTYGENMNWSFIDGNLVVEGTGVLDWNVTGGLGGIKTVEVKEGITAIGEGAFQNCNNLTTITIPESVTSIGSNAFYGCSKLSAVHISSIEAWCGISFANTRSNPLSQAGSLYLNGALIRELVVPEGVKSIGDYAFYRCSLTSITISEGVTEIGVCAFGESYIRNITIPESVILIGKDAFYRCYRLTSITIPEGVTSIGEGTFFACINLTSITIPESVTSIGSNAFHGCSKLPDITIPKCVESIGSSAFAYCSGLTYVYCYAETVPSTEIDAFVGSSIESATLYVPADALESYKASVPWDKFGYYEIGSDVSVTITIDQYGSGTYCSKYALDFGNVEGLKAYAATGYNSGTGVVTLVRVMTAKAGEGIFIKGEPGKYMVPIMESTLDNTLNMLVGTLAKTSVNATSDDGLYANYKYTIKAGEAEPKFYQFTDGSTLGAGKAYLQIPTAWLPATDEAKSISLRFEEGEGTTDMENSQFTIDNSQLTYDLYGRRVDNPVKGGIYIVGGRKVVY